MHNFLRDLACKEADLVIASMPKDPFVRYYHFFEMTRVLEYWATSYHGRPSELRPSPPVFTMLSWGWNLALEHFFSGFSKPGFPMWESTAKSRDYAFNILHRLGRSVLLRRAADMVEFGYIFAEEIEGRIVFKRAIADVQVLDNLEYELLEELHIDMSSSDSGYFNGWKLMSFSSDDDFPTQQGAFWGSLAMPDLDALKLDNVDEVMEPLVRPWDSEHGIMVAYDALPELDAHFFSVALKLVLKWREEAGIHPRAKFSGFSGVDLSVVAAAVVSILLKHMRFVSIAAQLFPQISIPQSLTIWCAEREMIDDISSICKMDVELVERVMEVLVFRHEDVRFLKGHTTPFRPLLISLGNGQLIKMVSSLAFNPFSSIVKVMQWRNPSVEHSLAFDRENWQRSHLYGLFMGNRYERVEGNIKLRVDGKDLTDIDAAIFDTVSGDLALFQLKWQDYFTNDVRRLRSKASNLSRDLDEWAGRLELWISKFGVGELAKNLRLNIPDRGTPPCIHFFALSWSVARVEGYGFNMKNKNISVMTWPQFMRIRTEAGLCTNIFDELFVRGREEVDVEVESINYPYVAEFSSVKIEFIDLWKGY